MQKKQKRLQSCCGTKETANEEIKLKTYQNGGKIQLLQDTVGVRVKNSPSAKLIH